MNGYRDWQRNMRFRCTSIQVKAGLPKTGILHTDRTKTDYVTIAHQDDIYEPNYLKMIFGELKKVKNPIVVFTDYGELRDGEKVTEINAAHDQTYSAAADASSGIPECAIF